MSGRTTASSPIVRPRVAFVRTTLPAVTRGRVTVLEWILRLATAGAFTGHGAYGVVLQKPGWYPFFAELGIGSTAVDDRALMAWVGGAEMLLGLSALVLPIPAVLLFMVVWKLGTELVWYPLAGKPAWECVERWANYTAPLALLLVRGWPKTVRAWWR